MSTYVLVHGGFCGGWYWNKLKVLLEAQHHTVYTPTLTGLGERCHLNNNSVDLATHIEDIKNILLYEGLDNIILVGHSYGGLVIAGVASALPEKIAKLVYIDALVPQDGDSLFSLVDKPLVDYFTSRAEEQGDGWLIPPNDSDFSNPEDTIWCKNRFTSQTLKSFAQRVTLHDKVVASIPSVYMYCSKSPYPMTKFKMIASKRGWPCIDLTTGHFPMITDPEYLADILTNLRD